MVEGLATNLKQLNQLMAKTVFQLNDWHTHRAVDK
jgi:hypothetical protein